MISLTYAPSFNVRADAFNSLDAVGTRKAIPGLVDFIENRSRGISTVTRAGRNRAWLSLNTILNRCYRSRDLLRILSGRGGILKQAATDILVRRRAVRLVMEKARADELEEDVTEDILTKIGTSCVPYLIEEIMWQRKLQNMALRVLGRIEGGTVLSRELLPTLAIIGRLKAKLRDYTRSTLQKSYGTGWFSVVRNALTGKEANRIQRALQLDGRPQSAFLEYTTLSQLTTIIGANWPLFSQKLGDKRKFDRSLHSIRLVRNAYSHFRRPLPSREKRALVECEALIAKVDI